MNTTLLLAAFLSASIAGSPPGECVPIAGVQPEQLKVSLNSASTIASGMSVHFVSRSQDHYEDGGFDVLTEVRFTWGEDSATEIVSALAKPAFRPVLGHCWRLEESGDDSVVVKVVAAQGTKKLPVCTDGTHNDLPILEDYGQIAVGQKYRATLRYGDQSHQWEVYPQPKILLHHATRMHWTNLAEQGRRGLGLARGTEVTTVFRVESSDIRKDPGRNPWFSEHKATLESACALR